MLILKINNNLMRLFKKSKLSNITYIFFSAEHFFKNILKTTTNNRIMYY